MTPDDAAFLAGLPSLAFGFALVLMMLFRPSGLWPSSLRKRELDAKRAEPGVGAPV